MTSPYSKYPYDKNYEFQSTEKITDDIELWQNTIDQLFDNPDDTIINEQTIFVDNETKVKIKNANDINLQKNFLLEHHQNEIKKLMKKRDKITVQNLEKKGLRLWKVDGVRIPINPEWNNIVVMLSGGADSACLTYNLCKIIETYNLNIKVHIFSGIRVWKSRPWAADVSERVYNWLKNRFENILGQRHTYFVPTYFEHSNLGNAFDGKPGETIILAEYLEFLCSQQKYNAVYDATTQNPKNYSGKRMEVRDESTAQVLVGAHDNYWKLGPLQTTAKDWIIKQYKDNNILDLLKLTRSCEGDAYLEPIVFGRDYKWYDKNKQVPECGRCFWCEERKWALEVNGIEL